MIHLGLDTCVVIDFLTDRKPFSREVAELFELSQKGKAKLYITAVSYNNTYYIIRKLVNHQAAIKTLRHLHIISETVETDNAAINDSLNSGYSDFEDAVTIYSMMNNKKISGFVTRNTKDFKKSKIPVMTPHQAVGLFKV
jgi:predicted nucleic acid-binding protein